MLCINCNSSEVARDKDTFTCAKCGYQWDVAHEQANAAYLASQGRTPAKPMDELAEIEATSALDAALGLGPVQPPDGQPVQVSLTGDERARIGEKQPLTDEERARIAAILDTKTVPDLEAIAGQAKIDLAEARLKADKIMALVESGRVYLADDRQTVIVVDKE